MADKLGKTDEYLNKTIEPPFQKISVTYHIIQIR